MDPILNEESKTEPQADPGTEPRIEPRKRNRRKKRTIPIPSFLTHLGADVRWYYDIRLWSPLILLLLILALLPGKEAEEKTVETVPAVTVAETVAAISISVDSGIALERQAALPRVL